MTDSDFGGWGGGKKKRNSDLDGHRGEDVFQECGEEKRGKGRLFKTRPEEEKRRRKCDVSYACLTLEIKRGSCSFRRGREKGMRKSC